MTSNPYYCIRLLITLSDRHLATSQRIHSDSCFLASHQMKLQWSQYVIVVWRSFGDSILKSSWTLHCDESLNNITMISHGDSQVPDISKLHCDASMIAALWKVSKWLMSYRWFVSLGDSPKITKIITLQWCLRMRVTWESQVTSLKIYLVTRYEVAVAMTSQWRDQISVTWE